MKKSFLSLLLIGACGATMAQRQVGTATRADMPAGDFLRTPTDSIVSAALNDPDMQPTIYGVSAANGGGWVVGTNGYGDKAKAQAFTLDNAVSAEGIGVVVSEKRTGSGNPNASVAFKIYQNNGAGVNSASAITTGAPGDEWASVDVLLNDLDTTGAWTWVNVPPVYVTDFFSVGVDFSGLTSGDSLGILSTDDGYTEYQDFSWELWSDDTWHTMLQAWPLDIDFFISVIVDASSVGIDDAGTFNGMRMSFLNGNLVGQDVELAYTVDHSAMMQLIVTDAAGRTVLNENLGNIAAGLYNRSLNASSWNAGTYYVVLVADGQTLTKKMVKQ